LFLQRCLGKKSQDPHHGIALVVSIVRSCLNHGYSHIFIVTRFGG
jgi:hypothetical protein